jgi:hypothetical protein
MYSQSILSININKFAKKQNVFLTDLLTLKLNIIDTYAGAELSGVTTDV